MDCREFRNKHVAYVDDLLSGIDMRDMRRHLDSCRRCSRMDTAVRRSLLLVRNLPNVEPSPDFMARLNARLEALGPSAMVDRVAPRPYLPSLAAFAALAAGIAAAAFLAAQANPHFVRPGPAELPPVIASLPTAAPAPVSNAALVASVPTGIPVWPAMMIVGQAPMHFASMDFREDEAQTR